MEFRLLTEPAFIEEFDTIVDEITDQYVRGEFEGEELQRVEQYFLKARERKFKARVASTLMKHAEAMPDPVPVPAPTLIERLLAFFSPQGMAFKFASTAAVLVLVVGIVYIVSRGPSGPQTLAQLELSVSDSDRAEAPKRKLLQLAPGEDGARFVLTLPEDIKPFPSYRVELVTRDGAATKLEVPEQNSRTIIAIAPASLLKRGAYAINLTGLNADGTSERLRDVFYFNVN